ncbi:MAG: PAS domain-containing sensor histidine kinase [Patescibacteria group bacterium]
MFGRNKKNEDAAAAQTKLSDIILSAIDDGVVLIDPEGKIASFNQAAEEISGWQSGDTLGLDYKSVIKFVDTKGESYSEDPISRSMSEKQVARDNEVELQTASKKQVPIFISCSPLLGSGEQFEGVVAVFRDVSKERVEESQRAEFISTASHEMRTPVAAIEGYLALATNDAVCKIDSKARDYLEKAHSSTQHLGKLFQDLLTAAKSEDGRLTNHPVVTEVGAFLQEVADANRFAAEKKGLSVDFLVGSESDSQFGKTSTRTDATGSGSQAKTIKPLYYAHIDPDRMREAITNLFDNAVKYTEQGKITISIAGDDKVVQLRISDTGPGIPAEDVPHLFQKFYRVDNSSTRTIGGTGLGLFITKKIVELYNGKIWVESTLDKGSTFFINLPRLSSTQAQAMKSTESQDQIIPTESLGIPKV